MKEKKKSNKRSKTKYPALNPSLNLKTRYELIDYDYIDKLSDKEKAFLNQFTEEYVNDNVNRKNLKKNLFATTKEKKKECDDRNNARNRCILTRAKASGMCDDIEEIKEKIKTSEEDKAIDKLDKEDLFENFVDFKNTDNEGSDN